VGPRDGLDATEKIKFLTLLGLELGPSIVQPVASRYTVYAIPVLTYGMGEMIKYVQNFGLKTWVKATSFKALWGGNIKIKIYIFWDIKLCSPLKVNRHLGRVISIFRLEE
jgi:hypothetical protein